MGVADGVVVAVKVMKVTGAKDSTFCDMED
jgi:hypothetical protein